jgi:hypothetical protein
MAHILPTQKDAASNLGRFTHVTNKLSKDAAKRMGEALWG